jgi:hypothetical protein
MDTTNQINSIVENIVTTINNNVQAQVATSVNQQIAETVAGLDLTALATQSVNKRLTDTLNRLPIDTNSVQAALMSKMDQLTQSIVADIQAKATALINETILTQVGKVDFPQLINNTLLAALQGQKLSFPNNSIPTSAFDSSKLLITGDNVRGGIVQNFGSTGIDDKATQCQLTIFDESTVIENNLLTRNLTVKGTTTIEGDLNITGTVSPSSQMFQTLVNHVTQTVKVGLDGSMFATYADEVFKQIKTQGLDLSRLVVNGQTVIDGPTLSSGIIYSNLQKVGVLNELQTSGETLLSQTLYVTPTRVGVNTIQPSQALSVWDEEVEIGFGKQSTNVGVMGTTRQQNVVLSSNGKNNITLTPDGTATIPKLQIGTLSVTSSATPPNYEAPQGSIVFNEKPSLGGPLGWVSLGAANWANFGIVD